MTKWENLGNVLSCICSSLDANDGTEDNIFIVYEVATRESCLESEAFVNYEPK